MSKQKIKNGVYLMLNLFAAICASAQNRRITGDGGDLVVELQSGPNEGHAARLSYNPNERSFTVEMHHSKGSAFDPTHANEAFLTMGLTLGECQVTDAQRGNLYRMQFWNKQPLGLMQLRSVRSKGLPFLIQFLELLEELPSEHIWNDEVHPAWHSITPERSGAHRLQPAN